jgi:hypothetical protein
VTGPIQFDVQCKCSTAASGRKTIQVYDEGLRPGNRDIECCFNSVLLQVLLLIVMCVVYALTLLSFH